MVTTPDKPGRGSRAAPPTTPGTLAPSRVEPSWPFVIGTLAILFGSLGGLGHVAQMLAPLMVELVAPMVPARQAELTGFDGVRGLLWIAVPIAGVKAMGAVMQIVGGAMLAARRAAGTRVLVLFSIIDIAGTIALTIVQLVIQRAQLSAMPGGAVGVPASMQGMMSVLGVGGAILHALFYWAWPVFLLVWFSRAPVRATIDHWRARGAPA